MWGCRNPQIVWSLAVKSPDGRFVATGRGYANNGGFGSDGAPATFVYLKWAGGARTGERDILEFSNDSSSSEGEAVGIKWISSNRLEVTYRKDKQELAFQAVKFLDVQIDVADVSGSKVVH
jgi:hypothetical protein